MGHSPTDPAPPVITRHGNRYRHGLRVDGKREPGYATPEEALRRALDILEARRQARPVPHRPAAIDPTLGAWADRLYNLKAKARNQHGKPLAPATVQAMAAEFKPWRSHPWRDRAIPGITALEVEDWFAEERAVHPDHANRKLGRLQAVLSYAAARGVQGDPAVLDLEPGPLVRRPRKALTVAQLRHLAACIHPSLTRLVLLQGQVGNRISELLTLTVDRVHLAPDLESGTITIPAHLCKERRDKTIDLLPPECVLLAEQIVSRPLPQPGVADLVFPTVTGKAWGLGEVTGHFRKAGRAALEGWTLDLEAEVRSRRLTCPFPNVTSHDLRATAITLACELDVPLQAVAARVGHKDTRMVQRVYNRMDPRARNLRAYQAAAPRGILEAFEGAPAAAHSAATSAPGEG